MGASTHFDLVPVQSTMGHGPRHPHAHWQLRANITQVAKFIPQFILQSSPARPCSRLPKPAYPAKLPLIMSLLFFAERARTMTEPWFAPCSPCGMDDFFPQAQAHTRQHAMRAQARSQDRAGRARRQRLKPQRREFVAAQAMAIEAARRQAMQQEYERRQRKVLALRHQQRQRRQEQQCLRAHHRQKQRNHAIQKAMDQYRRDSDMED